MTKLIEPMDSGIFKILHAAVLACAISMCLAATTCSATEVREAVDEQPQQIGPNLWHFAVRVGVRPLGAVQFACAEYDFAAPTEGIEVDYDFNGAGLDFADDRMFYAIAPTLFDQIHGFINGWDAFDLRDGIFSGVVYATAPLTAVHLMIEADRLVRVRRAPLRAPVAQGNLGVRRSR